MKSTKILVKIMNFIILVKMIFVKTLKMSILISN